MKKHTIAPLLLLLSVSAVMAQETADTVLIVNEVQSANIDQYLDNANCYGGWIELYNPMAEDISLQGFILTDMTQKLGPEMLKQWESKIPMRRGGTPAEVAKVCTFLASDLASYVSGQVILVDGGMGM